MFGGLRAAWISSIMSYIEALNDLELLVAILTFLG